MQFILEQQAKHSLQRREYEESFLPKFQKAMATLNQLTLNSAARNCSLNGNTNNKTLRAGTDILGRMIMSTKTEAIIDDLYRVPENAKAELVNRKIVLMSPTGGVPGRTAGAIYVCLHEYERRIDGGYAFPGNVGFIVNSPKRRSFSPDAAFYKGELRGGLFLEGAPTFAVEVRSLDDYGSAAEARMAQKRADYFAAGTLVVWDVDVLREKLVLVYRSAEPQTPTHYHEGDVAEAEPALPGWTVTVAEIFK